MTQRNLVQLQQAIALHQQGALDQAYALYQQILLEYPNHSEALHLTGVILSQRGDDLRGIEFMDRALAFMPNDANIWSNRARVLIKAHRLEPALQSAHRALSINPNHADAWYHAGSVHRLTNNIGEAMRNFSRAIELNPNHFNALKHRSTSLQQVGQIEAALNDSKRARALNPHDNEVTLHQAMLYFHRGMFAEAVLDYEAFLKANPHHALAIDQYCQSLRILGRLREVADCLIRNNAITTTAPWLEGELVHALAWICDWSELGRINSITSRVYQGQETIDPIMAIGLFDDPKILLQVGKTFTRSQHGTPVPEIAVHSRSEKIRIGYYSADFRNHAISMLIPEVIESHNRELFEVYLFSLTAVGEDPYRQRLRQACDHFVQVESMNVGEVVKKSRELKIDIAIDLMGYSANNRHAIFTSRCAPVQVNWLGMASTSGSTPIDYIIADSIVVPEKHQEFYSEKIIHLPCYWPNDSKRKISENTPSRAAMGLPDDAFVFCCFNATFKILPETFEGWMRILATTPRSVLWLSGGKGETNDNLRKAAEKLGIDSQRLIFSTRLPAIEDHLARIKNADLFLDTFPYNAHTTAVDALWGDVPVLTRSGQAFASRVGASLLTRIGLPELITDNQADFEARAIHLANDGRAELKAIRDKLAILRKTSPLFDGKAFAKDLEKAYQAMYDRSQAGLKPDFISVV